MTGKMISLRGYNLRCVNNLKCICPDVTGEPEITGIYGLRDFFQA